MGVVALPADHVDPDPIALVDRIKASGDEVGMYLLEYITDETYI